MGKLKLVRFQVGYGAYNSGEEAGFSEAEASTLVAAGRAVLVTKTEAPVTVEEAPPPVPTPEGVSKGDVPADGDSKGGKPRNKR